MEISAVRKCFWCLTNKINQINVEHVNGFILLFVCLWELTLKFWSNIFLTMFGIYQQTCWYKHIHTHTHTHTYTVMAKNIGTLAILSKIQHLSHKIVPIANVLVFSVLIVFVCTATTQKNWEEKSDLIKFHTELKNGLDKIIGTLSKL